MSRVLLKSVLLRSAVVLLVLYLGGLAVLTWAMLQPPERFAGVMARLPGAVFLFYPFETMMTTLRDGDLQVGQPAPDFDLLTTDKATRVQLSSFRGQSPVVLVFGSYT